MASVQASRFALLHIDDDNDSDGGKPAQKLNAKGSQPQAKKKNKKKKANQQKENEELRNLAFVKGGKQHQGSASAGVSTSVICAKAGDKPGEQWKQWQDADKEFVTESYEKDLQQALLLSKLDAEEQKTGKPNGKDESGKSSNQKQKKKKDKPKTMSLGEFQQPEVVETNGSGDGVEDITHEPDPKFFKTVDDDAHKIIRKEQIQEEYKKQYIVENARSQQYEEKVRKKDQQVEKLKQHTEKLMQELKEVKERNQQLCMILAQGEMKGKTTVLMELDELKQVRDELTHEVTRLTTELEKERSKVHALQSSADKHEKADKHDRADKHDKAKASKRK